MYWYWLIGTLAVGFVAAAAQVGRLHRLWKRAEERAAGAAAAEGELARARSVAARNNAILRSAMDGFFVLGDDHRFIEVNEAFCRMVGYSATELSTMRMNDLEVHDDSPVGRRAGISSIGVNQFSAAFRHRGGAVIYLENSVIIVREGGRRLAVGFARDVTDRLWNEERLSTLMRQRQLILEAAGDAILGLDREGRVTFSNPAATRMLGNAASDGGGIRSLDTVRFSSRSQGWPSPIDLLRDVLAGGQPVRQRSEMLQRCDGTSIAVEVSLTPIVEAQTVSGAVLVIQDVSERQAAEEQRRALEQQIHRSRKMESLGLLAGGIAHDFNNLLVGILGNSSLAAELLECDHPARARIDRIVNAGQRASSIVHQIRAYTGRAMPDPNPIVLAEMVREHVEFVAPTLPRGIVLTCDLQDEEARVVADSGQIEQLLTNLTRNAMEAIGDGKGAIAIGLHRMELSGESGPGDFGGQGLEGGSYLALQVRDTGRGMSPETLGRIFEPFYSSKGAGRGLGLAAIHGIVRGHGGGIRVESRLGQGTTFEVIFPVTRAAPVPLSAPAPIAADGHGANRTLLVIDDEEDILDVAASILGARGFRVLTAGNGPDGISLFAAHAGEIDATLLDLTMPGMDGREVMREILAIQPNARIILSSGYSESEIASRVDRARAGFVRKPYTADGLLEQIGSALSVAVPQVI